MKINFEEALRPYHYQVLHAYNCPIMVWRVGNQDHELVSGTYASALDLMRRAGLFDRVTRGQHWIYTLNDAGHCVKARIQAICDLRSMLS